MSDDLFLHLRRAHATSAKIDAKPLAASLPDFDSLEDLDMDTNTDSSLGCNFDETTLLSRDVFTSPVTSSLPYRRVVISAGNVEFSGLMMDDERIVSLAVRIILSYEVVGLKLKSSLQRNSQAINQMEIAVMTAE